MLRELLLAATRSIKAVATSDRSVMSFSAMAPTSPSSLYESQLYRTPTPTRLANRPR
jgi:hypothetical protein